MRGANASLAGAIALLLATSSAPGAEFKIKNNDQPGEGFNDPTAATPVGGNPGTTVGAQRLRVFQEAARIWGELLPSNGAIDVDGTFDSQPCDSTGAVLGSVRGLCFGSAVQGAKFRMRRKKRGTR